MNIISYYKNDIELYKFYGLTKVDNEYIFDNVLVKDIKKNILISLNKKQFINFIKELL